MKTKTIVFIHGMYMTPLCWEQWTAFFGSKGYTCLAPAWPGRDKPIEMLRQNQPDAQLASLTLSAVVDHFAGAMQSLQEKPVLIGHSMGGLVVQLLLQRDLAAAGVALDSAPPLGVLSVSWPFLKSNWPHINPFVSKSQPIQMSFERFQYAFVNSLPLAEQRAAYDRFVVPESRRVPAQALTTAARVDFKRPHAPLLFIAGDNDHLIPASLVRANHSRYRDPSSVTDYKQFAGRTHFIIGQKNWEEVANYVLTWLDRQE
jgi:pimeloyl-ACP methyl ester carboxylesterase